MDLLSIVGLLIGLLAIVGGNALEGGHIESLANGPALVIVMGGTLGAIMLQTPLSMMKLSIQRLLWVFIPPKYDMTTTLLKIIEWSSVARREGLLGLESMADDETDPFIKKGLQLLVDGTEPDTIRSILEVDMLATEEHDFQAAKVYESMGGYSPTIGIIGAVMGLIHVMQNLADPSRLGAGIATAFVATIYGVGLANLVFLPIANKLKTLAKQRSAYHEMLIEGVVSIADGDNPRYVEAKLQGFVQ